MDYVTWPRDLLSAFFTCETYVVLTLPSVETAGLSLVQGSGFCRLVYLLQYFTHSSLRHSVKV